MENYNRIIANGGMVCYNSLASRLSRFRSGGSIDTLIEPTSRSGLIDAYDLLEDTPYILFGAASNTLISDEGIRGAALTTKRVTGSVIEGNTLYCNAGETLGSASLVAKGASLSGLEELSGIPGTIGGALCMNAGAYGRYISDIVEYVDVFSRGVEMRLYPNDLAFGYRDSVFQHENLPIIGCKLKLAPLNKILIASKMREYASKRREAQPEENSLGCVFKKVGIESAGIYIERAGLKGHGVGGAMVSTKHANFIVNIGGATSADYIELANICERTVEEKFRIKLIREVIYVGY